MKDEESAFSKDFPEKLRILRKNKGWSQGQLLAKSKIKNYWINLRR